MSTVKKQINLFLSAMALTPEHKTAIGHFRESVLDRGHPLIHITAGRNADFDWAGAHIAVTLDMCIADINDEASLIENLAKETFRGLGGKLDIVHVWVDYYYSGEAAMLRETWKETLAAL